MKKFLSTCFPAMVLLAFITTPTVACPDLGVGDSWSSDLGGTWTLSTSSGSSGSGALTAGYSDSPIMWSLYSLVTVCDVTIGTDFNSSSFSAVLGPGLFAFPAENIFFNGGEITQTVGSIYHLTGTGKVAANDLPVNIYGDLVWEHLQVDAFSGEYLTLTGTIKEIGLEVVPLPGTLLMLGTGLLGLLYVRRRFQRT